MNRQRWITATALAFLLLATTIALLAFAAAWTPETMPRCFADFAHSQFPKWLGCAFATHETLAGGLFAAGGALFGAWLAFVGLQDQIGLAQKNEQEAKRLESARQIQEAGRNVDLMRIAHGFVKSVADEFPKPELGVPQGNIAEKLLELRRSGKLRISSNAVRAPDGNGDSVKTVFDRLSTLADNLYEETKNLTADQRGATLRAREPMVISQVNDLRALANLLEMKIPIYELKFQDAIAPRLSLEAYSAELAELAARTEPARPRGPG
jgi:hypothetical protein